MPPRKRNSHPKRNDTANDGPPAKKVRWDRETEPQDEIDGLESEDNDEEEEPTESDEHQLCLTVTCAG